MTYSIHSCYFDIASYISVYDMQLLRHQQYEYKAKRNGASDSLSKLSMGVTCHWPRQLEGPSSRPKRTKPEALASELSALV